MVLKQRLRFRRIDAVHVLDDTRTSHRDIRVTNQTASHNSAMQQSKLEDDQQCVSLPGFRELLHRQLRE